MTQEEFFDDILDLQGFTKLNPLWYSYGKT
jgi:hypothetical protein